ncbi:MAG: hypothetical protein DI556_07535 [Rhodovulum sulfidophilum]|uniref:Acyltransferase 3 domain-containing protein n=1 Tax=Rhodovulum sulfidophilum TaxID=35806 RepID=A0A2W5ND06_RHOSU|nr:MAG: hypothetical protein DI556_07535 [Rhodovulum sulfidophilum]
MAISWAGKSLMDLDTGGAAERVAWADIAKAFSIILLVIWSMYGLSVYIDQMLILARMPMFFFVSGLFAHRVITRSEPLGFFRDKVGNLLYLYAIWAIFWYLSTEVVAYLWWGRPIEAEISTMVWDPIVEMWFFYGLAIAFAVAFLCRRLPVWAVFAVSMLAYLVVVARGDWLAIPFIEKVIRLFPYFWLGLVLRPIVWRTVDAHWRLWPLFAAAFLGLSYWLMDSPWQRFGPLTFAVTAIGIAALLGLAARTARFDWAWILKLVGGSTLYIYATQHITIFYLERVFGMIGPLPFEKLIMVPIVLVVGTLFGRWCARREGFRLLFSAPWAPYKPPSAISRPAPASAAGARAAGAKRREA